MPHKPSLTPNHRSLCIEQKQTGWCRNKKPVHCPLDLSFLDTKRPSKASSIITCLCGCGARLQKVLPLYPWKHYILSFIQSTTFLSANTELRGRSAIPQLWVIYFICGIGWFNWVMPSELFPSEERLDDAEDGIRTHACRAQWISSPSP